MILFKLVDFPYVLSKNGISIKKICYLVWTLVSKEKAQHRHTMTVVEALWSVETFLRVSKLTKRTICMFLNFMLTCLLDLGNMISTKHALSEITIF